MVGHPSEVPGRLDESEALEGGEKSRGKGRPEWREKGGNVFLLSYAGVVFLGE